MLTAARGASGQGRGSLKKTITPSPVKRSSVPSCSKINSPSSAWYSRRTPWTSSGSADSANEVKPRRSAKTTVISQRWLSSSFGSREDHLAHLRRQESLQATDPLDLGDLLRDPCLERAVPALELRGLSLDLSRYSLIRSSERTRARSSA